MRRTIKRDECFVQFIADYLPGATVIPIPEPCIMTIMVLQRK